MNGPLPTGLLLVTRTKCPYPQPQEAQIALLLPGLGRSARALRPHPRPPAHSTVVPQMLAARQQARRLRRARPPSAAQLSVIREKMRRETRTRVALRWVAAGWALLCSCSPWDQSVQVGAPPKERGHQGDSGSRDSS